MVQEKWIGYTQWSQYVQNSPEVLQHNVVVCCIYRTSQSNNPYKHTHNFKVWSGFGVEVSFDR